METKKQSELFETSDFCLASYLTYLGFKLFGLKNEKKERKVFVFERDAGIDEAIQRFWKREAIVEPQDFWLTEKFLKSRLYNAD